MFNPLAAQKELEAVGVVQLASPVASEVSILPAPGAPPVIFTWPATSNFAPGLPVPMPILPEAFAVKARLLPGHSWTSPTPAPKVPKVTAVLFVCRAADIPCINIMSPVKLEVDSSTNG